MSSVWSGPRGGEGERNYRRKQAHSACRKRARECCRDSGKKPGTGVAPRRSPPVDAGHGGAMKGLLLVAIGALILSSTPGRASAQPAHPHRAKATLTISAPLFVGDTLVKPGDYKVQCVDVQGKDVLVMTSIDTGREVVRVPCKPEILSEKVGESSF